MKNKIMLLISTMCLALSLTACSGNTEKENDNVSDQSMQESENTVEEESQSSEEKEAPDTASDEYETEADTTDTIIDGLDMDNLPINWGTPDGPETAVRNYYKNTVFELVSFDVLKSSKEYVLFSVVSKKGGELVDPNRTIELRYEDGVWNVINEGY